MEPRTLPIRVPPVPGEALESWLGVVAQRLNASWGDLLTAVAPPQNRASLHRPSLTAYLHTTESSAIAAATGVWQGAIEALTMNRYDGHLITIDPSTRLVRSPWVSRRSRFCPRCLHRSGGRWQLVWRLPWVFACEEHACFLADTCPTCGQFQRVSPWWLPFGAVPDLVRCTSNIEAGGLRWRCEGNLLEAVTIALPPDHPLAMAQARLSEVLSTAPTTFGVYKVNPASSLEVLNDLRVLAPRILSLADFQDIDELLGRHASSVSVLFSALGDGSRSWENPQAFAATAPALITGVGITLALKILACPTIDEAASRLRPIIRNRRASGQNATPTHIRHGQPSAVLEAVYVRTFADSFAPVDKLRYRTPTTLPRYPDKLTPAAVRATPTCFWPDWAFRFMIGKLSPKVIRPVLSIMLLITGTPISATTAARHLGSRTTELKFSRALNDLHCHPLWPNIAAAIIRLSDYLAENPGPIDYQRRRHLNYRDLLTANQWNEIYDWAYFRSFNSDRVGELVRSWLFERVSLQPAYASPFPVDSHHAARFRAELVAQFTPTLLRELDYAAADFLKRHGVIGEPVTWSPPLSIIADLELPGPDPAAVSVTQLHEAMTDTTTSMAALARHLQLPTPVVLFLLERSPLARPAVRRQTQLEYAATQLTHAEFVRLYHHDRLSLKTIAGRIGVESKVASKLAHQYGIEVRDVSRKLPDNPDWIYQEHVVKLRTLTDMAREIGMPLGTLSHRAKRYGIPVWRDRRTWHTSKKS